MNLNEINNKLDLDGEDMIHLLWIVKVADFVLEYEKNDDTDVILIDHLNKGGGRTYVGIVEKIYGDSNIKFFVGDFWQENGWNKIEPEKIDFAIALLRLCEIVDKNFEAFVEAIEV
jgi:hypothetical protein